MTQSSALQKGRLALLTLVWVWAFGGQATAQSTYGNEWINYSQNYYKIKVAQNGIYRLDYDYLTKAGISGIDPRKFQLFRRGKEVAIRVAGETDGALNPTDFIEFYGERNDGKLDVELYKDPAHQIHNFYSLYTDTAAYFLTWSAADGKRMSVQDSDPGIMTPEPYHYQEKLQIWTETFIHGFRISDSKVPWMDLGEGFLSNGYTTSKDFVLNGIVNVEPKGFKPSVEVAVSGGYQGGHEMNIFVVSPSGASRLLGNVKFQDYEFRKLKAEIEFSEISGAGGLKIRLTPKGPSPDWYTLSYIKVDYPQKPILNNKALTLSVNPLKTSPSYLLFNTPPVDALAYDITDPASVIRISGHDAGTKRGFVVPAANGVRRDMFINGQSSYLTPPFLPQKVSFRQVRPANHNYIIVTHPKLRAPSGDYANPPQDYAAYRASATGGGYDTLVVEVGQLYDQFHYGEKSASAIQRFMRFMMATGSPRYLLLLGKGLDMQHRGGFFRKNPYTATEQDLVPPSGSPGSDLMYSSYWETGKFAPAVATGRISAFTSKDVVSYLEKVKLHESLAHDLEWRKSILHLGGGQTEQEIRQFRNFLDLYKERAEKPFFGAHVNSIYRSNSRDIVTNLNVSKQVNNGLSLITFFGHSSTTISDIDIGNVSNNINGYRNSGKFPMILMNGCNSGNVFTSKSFGEDWILTPDRGAILFLAHTGAGFPSTLNLYSTTFYETAFNDQTWYGKSVGDVQLEVIRKVNNSTNSVYSVAMVAEMVLQGDPAVALFSPAKPDYELTDQALTLTSMDGSPVSASSEKLLLSVDLKNLGKATTDSFYLSVKRTLPNNEEVLVDSLLFPPVFNHDTLMISLDATEAYAMGINKFEVFVDHINKIDELTEDNNIGKIEYFFKQSGVGAVYPPEYGIVSSNRLTLTGNASDLPVESVEYYFELDTTHVFKKPLQTAIVKAGMLPEWEVTLPDHLLASDSIVYFWRFRLNTIEAGTDTLWGQSSFRYIQNSPQGWSQSHSGQFVKATLQEIDREEAALRWEFGQISKRIEIRGTGGNIAFRYPPYGVFVDGSAYFNNTCGYSKPNILVAVFHPSTLERYKDMPAGTGTVCGTEPKSFYQFVDLGQAANQAKLEAFLRAIPEDYHVALVSMNKVPFSAFGESLKEAFRGIGSELINSLQTGYPFALVGRKGLLPGGANEITFNAEDATDAGSQEVNVLAEITGKAPFGTITSSRIGPAKQWGTLYHQILTDGFDTYSLKVIGIGQDGQERVLVENVPSTAFDLQDVDAALYPFLKLILTISDAPDRTAPQLKQWIVTYTGLPEGVMRPDLVAKDSYDLSAKPAKSSITFPFVFQNVSEIGFEEKLTAEVTLYKANGTETVEQIELHPLPGKDTLRFDYTLPATGLAGENRMRVFINPMILPELSYTNNIFEFTFKGREDVLHPVLDVVFDGIHIMDGDIVSPSPVITMSLQDENKVMFIEDPSLMEIFLKRPGGADFEIIDLVTSAADIHFTPGNDKNPFRLEYHPKELADGLYELRVQGKDAVGNISGKEMYQINFEVINESAITRFYPYPNPFSSNTRFIFTLTGSTIPENLKIQIMTVTGKVIREITKEEIGPIRIGNNTSQFAWNGTDEFGDKLANGVYLYRVVMDREQEEFKHRRTAGDKAFRQEYGKLYILR